ncbi:unnamed protein product [Rotaria socialis]|uniref:Uncharacterized protein n=1 Tax=Rotaria socialis TaxID=392032 RepID=A0A817ZJB2_9BILA|nr:unnamed protein product [Rotaria socialis]
MRRALSPSTMVSTFSSPAKRPKMVVSRNTTVNIDRIHSELDVVTIPRSYQTELMEQAKHENLIICLPTGSGKTYIAVMLIKEMAHTIRASIRDGGKRTIFLAKTVALVQQQSDYIRFHTDLSVGKYYGELGVDLWQKERWVDEFEQHQVLVFSAQVFLNLVDHNYFPLYKVNLLIFDECQHSTGESCYAGLMNRHYNGCHDPPRILGLTASISGKKITPGELSKVAKQIENIYKARVASGSDREESNRHGTSVQIEHIYYLSYEDEICSKNESIMIAFDTIESILADLGSYLSKQKAEREKIEHDLVESMLMTDYLGLNLTEYNALSVDYTIFLQSEYINLPRLKYYLKNLIHTGYELGIYGLFLAAEALQKVLKLSQALYLITNSDAKELFDSSSQRIDCLVDDILRNLVHINLNNDQNLFSSKVLNLFQRIKKDVDDDNLGRCIVFVERIYTAAILSKILAFLSEKMLLENKSCLKIKYLTGPRANIGDAMMSAKYQRQVIKEFRTGEINVLVATAIAEEGLDITKCNLVFRFNKPPNFSSYMQSKGRARAKQNAAYVILIDKSNENIFSTDLFTYHNYEEIQKMLQEEFSIDNDDDLNTNDLNQLEPYRTDNGVVISAIRAAQIIYDYCTIIGNGRLCPPRILYHKTDHGTFSSILSMPANCPIRDDIICENRRKKLAKFECCLKMVKLLHENGELNDDCLPCQTRFLMMINDISIDQQLFKLRDELFETKDDNTMEIFPKQISSFPCQPIVSSDIWYLYRINIKTEKDKLGFVVPLKLDELPNFCLYTGNNEMQTVDIVYVKTIDYRNYRNQLEHFAKYLFENVFNGIVNSLHSIIEFNIEHSSFKLLPCLLKSESDVNEIDCERMLSICNRLNKSVEHQSPLSMSELYVAWHLPHKPLYTIMPDTAPSKRTSDLWAHKMKSEAIKTYADYFEKKLPNISIRRDALMATMKAVSYPRINYLNEVSTGKKENKNSTNDYILSQLVYYPIELLHYAPVNQADMKLFYKLPSILVRLTQLHWIEQLRRLFASELQIYSTRRPLLPLTLLTYNSATINNELTNDQPSPDIFFQAITRRSCSEQMDNENFEVLGDSFLKLMVSMSLYYRYPLASPGLLTAKKIKQISNENLYRLAVQKQLKIYLNVKKIVFRGKDANWLPPGYKINETELTTGQQYSHQNAKRKAFSDMIEAFIGAFLISTNYMTTIKFMDWLGLDVMPNNAQDSLVEPPSILRSNIATNNNIQINEIMKTFFVDRVFAEIETKIQYVFKNKAYLIAAFTHPSNYANRITDCYERLEFLGDALLDFLVTRHVFVNYNQNVTPGKVTDIRQDLSNNGRLAYILVACDLHKKILHNSTDLFSQISSYAGDEDLFPKDQSTDEYLSKDLDQWADSTAPKALADVFEALVGAIFLDAGNCLETVWRVVEPLLRKYIDQSIIHPNLNPIRSFSEHGGKLIKESIDKGGDTQMAVCIVQMPNGSLFEGRGVNKKLAKANACRQAMKQQQHNENIFQQTG